MSTDPHGKVRRIPRHGIAESTVSTRSFGGWITGGALVLALVLGAAMPVKADQRDDLVKGLIAALVVGAIINELDRGDPRPEPVRHKRVPAVCAISIDGAERSVTLFAESCLRREGVDHRLPRGCANTARIFGREDRVYSAGCLRDAGFRIPRRGGS